MSGFGSPGYFTEGQIGNTLAEAEGTSLVPAPASEVLGASLAQAWHTNPTARVYRFLRRNTEANPITMPAAEANAEYGIPGRLTFDAPVSRQTARDMHDHAMGVLMREDVISRREGGLLTGGVARFLAAAPAAFIDPLNVASAFLPGVREARVAAFLGTAGATAASRAGVRLLSGASQGVVGAAAVEPLNMWLAMQEQDDYTMGDLLTNLAFGAALGGALHTTIGAVRDRTALPPWSPQQHEAALRQSLAAVAENRPIAAAEAMQLVGARQAREGLERWYESVTRIARDADDAMARADAATIATQGPRQRLAELRQDFEKITAEVAEARSRLSSLGLDDTTSARLTAIDAELADTIPRARRKALEQERQMLLEGGNPDVDLSIARTAAEVRGLQQAQQRARLAVARAERTLAATERRAGEASSLFGAASKALSAREAITRDLAARTIRQAAARLGVQMAPEEAAEMASRLMRASPERAPAVLDEIVGSLSGRAPAGPYRPDDIASVGRDTMERVRQELGEAEAQAAGALRTASQPRRDPRDVAADRAAETRAARAPKAEGDAQKQLAELQQEVQRIEAVLDAMEADRLAVARDADEVARIKDEMRMSREQANAITDEGEAMGRAYEAAAICAIRRA